MLLPVCLSMNRPVLSAKSGGSGGSGRSTGRVNRWKLLQANWAYQGKQFFTTSTLHGVRYIAERGRPYHERLLWFISTTGGLMAALVIVDSLWDKFQTSPTITGLDTDYHSWDVPFPAITLCLQDSSNETRVNQYIDEKWPDADEEKKLYYFNFLTALTNIRYSGLPGLLPFVNDSSLPQEGLRLLTYKMVSRCQVFTRCAYKQSMDEDERDCCSLLQPVFTENGFCYAFNLNYTAPDWPEPMGNGPFNESYIEETDARWSFSFETENPENNTVGVYISSSDALPGAEVNPQHVWNRRVSKLMFVPKMTYTVEAARSLSPKQRGCVFPDEVKLHVSHVYTFSACTRQCRMDHILKKCKCLPYFYTLLPGQRHCRLAEMKCLIDNMEVLSPLSMKCECPLGCEHTVYDMEKPHEAGGDAGGEGGEGSGVEVGFLSWPLTRYKREVLFGQVDLLVAIGTIAGLFLGFSLLSGLEIIYLFTLRAWCMLHTDREHLEELAEEYEKQEKEPVDLALRPAFLKPPSAVGAALGAAEEGVVAVSPFEDKMAPNLIAPTGPPMWKRDPVLANNAKNSVDVNGLYRHLY